MEFEKKDKLCSISWKPDDIELLELEDESAPLLNFLFGGIAAIYYDYFPIEAIYFNYFPKQLQRLEFVLDIENIFENTNCQHIEEYVFFQFQFYVWQLINRTKHLLM